MVARVLLVAALTAFVLPAQGAPPLADFVAACAKGDAAAVCTALARLAAAPDATAALPQLRAHAGDVPLRALVPFAKLCADLLPWGTAEDHAAADGLANTIDGRAEAFVGACGKVDLPELANQISRVFARGSVDGNGPIEKLVQQVDGAFEQVREAACEALARRGKAALPALDALQHLLARTLPENGHTKLLGEYYPMRDEPRLAAARAIVALIPAEPAAAAAHGHLVAHGASPGERRVAVAALGALGAAAAEQVPTLVDAATGADVALARDAVVALGQIGPAAAPAVPALETLAAGADKQTAAMATAALRQVKKPAK